MTDNNVNKFNKMSNDELRAFIESLSSKRKKSDIDVRECNKALREYRVRESGIEDETFDDGFNEDEADW